MSLEQEEVAEPALSYESDPEYIALMTKLAKLKHDYWMVRYYNAITVE